MARTAKLAIQMFCLTCPECDESVINPLRDSYDFTIGFELPKPGASLRCDGGHVVKMPRY